MKIPNYVRKIFYNLFFLICIINCDKKVSKHDDLLDGLFYATKKCYAPVHNETRTTKKQPYKEYIEDDISWKIA